MCSGAGITIVRHTKDFKAKLKINKREFVYRAKDSRSEVSEDKSVVLGIEDQFRGY